MALFQGPIWEIKSTAAPYVPAWRNEAFGKTSFDILLNNYTDDIQNTFSKHFHARSWEKTFGKELILDTSTRTLMTALNTKMHPSKQSMKLCGAVLLTTVNKNPYEILIPCNETIAKTLIICTGFPMQNDIMIQNSSTEYLFSTKITKGGLTVQPFSKCSEPWIPVRNQCLQVMKLDVHLMDNMKQAYMYCSRHNSSIYKENQASDFRPNLEWFLKTYAADKEMILPFKPIHPNVTFYVLFADFNPVLGDWKELNVYDYLKSPRCMC